MDAHGQQRYSYRLWLSNNTGLVLRGSACAEKTFLTTLHHQQQQPELLPRSRLGQWSHEGYAKFWPDHLHVTAETEIHQTRQQLSNI